MGSVSERLAALSAKREAGYASLAAKGTHAQAETGGAEGGVPGRTQQPAPITTNAIIDLGTLADDLTNTCVCVCVLAGCVMAMAGAGPVERGWKCLHSVVCVCTLPHEGPARWQQCLAHLA